MMVVTTTGYIVSVLGPYVGKNNDASILNHIVNENVEEFRHWIQEDDIAVVDRGFRDAVQLLKVTRNEILVPLQLRLYCNVFKSQNSFLFILGPRCQDRNALVPWTQRKLS